MRIIDAGKAAKEEREGGREEGNKMDKRDPELATCSLDWQALYFSFFLFFFLCPSRAQLN